MIHTPYWRGGAHKFCKVTSYGSVRVLICWSCQEACLHEESLPSPRLTKKYLKPQSTPSYQKHGRTLLTVRVCGRHGLLSEKAHPKLMYYHLCLKRLMNWPIILRYWISSFSLEVRKRNFLLKFFTLSQIMATHHLIFSRTLPLPNSATHLTLR